LRVAAVQLNSTDQKSRNLAIAERLVRAAAADGAELVALPEKWNLLAGGEALLAGAESLDGPSLGAAREWAADLGIHLLAGSIAERVTAPTSPPTARSTCSTSTSAVSPTASPTTRRRARRSSLRPPASSTSA
jgi:predicted amidohydrolase